MQKQIGMLRKFFLVLLFSILLPCGISYWQEDIKSISYMEYKNVWASFNWNHSLLEESYLINDNFYLNLNQLFVTDSVSLKELLDNQRETWKIGEASLKSYWNKNVDTIKLFLWKDDKKECDTLKEKKFDFYTISNLKYNNVYIKVTKDEMASYFACLFSEGYYKINSLNLKTTYYNYRHTNIKKGLDTIYNQTLKPWEDFSVGYHVFALPDRQQKYVKGDAIVYDPKTKKNIVKSVYWWWLCGVSTIMYQSILNDWNILIKERWPHSKYYQGLYWTNIGLDSTIYWWDFKNNKGYKDLIFTNNGKTTILFQPYIWKPYKWRFNYGVNIYNPAFKENETIVSKNKINKKWNCYFNEIRDKNTNQVIRTIKSCYNEVY